MIAKTYGTKSCMVGKDLDISKAPQANTVLPQSSSQGMNQVLSLLGTHFFNFPEIQTSGKNFEVKF
jgi:hypothetical protein